MMQMRLSRVAIFLAALVAAVVAASAPDSHAQSMQAVDARIVSIQCDAKLEKSGKGTEVPLQSPRDIGMGLTAGDKVRCAGAGSMDVFLPEGTKKITAGQGALTVEAVPANPPFPEIAHALEKYGIPGATRGMAVDSRIQWPADNSVVVPEHFVIRWAPTPQKIVLSIMTESKDAKLWGPTEVDGKTGLLKSDAVSSALASYKAKPGSSALLLTLTLAKSADWEEVHFSLLGGRQQQELDTQLDFWAKHSDGLPARLGRGYAYTQRKLFAEAADEYDAALGTAPGSLYLLEDAIQANRLAGRASRVKELQARLASRPGAKN